MLAPQGAFSSNTAAAASNYAWGALLTQCVFGSNTAVAASNTAALASLAAASSEAVVFGSNAAAFGSNAGRFGSNAAAFGSNASAFGSNAAAFGSNAAAFGSNAAVYGSNQGAAFAATLVSTAGSTNTVGMQTTFNSNVQVNGNVSIQAPPFGLAMLCPNMSNGNLIHSVIGASLAAYNCGMLKYSHSGTSSPSNIFQCSMWGQNSINCLGNGYVGINTVTPDCTLTVAGTLDVYGYNGSGGGGIVSLRNTNTVSNPRWVMRGPDWGNGATLNMYYSGNGTDAVDPAVNSNIPAYVCKVYNSTYQHTWSGSTYAFNDVLGTSQLNISSGGYIGIGTAAPTQKLHVVGQIYATDEITAFSDSNYKTDLRALSNALQSVDTLTGYTFAFKDDVARTRHVGLLAQEVAAVLPEAVITQADGKLSLAYGNLVALLVNAIKELKCELQNTNARVDALLAR